MIVNKDKYLTVHWNNLLTFWLAVPALTYVAIVFFSSVLSDKAGFIGTIAIGILYCLIVEQHSGMTLARQVRKSESYTPAKQSLSNKIIVVAYNLIWWVPIAFPMVGLTDYRTGSIIFFLITSTRAFINLYRVNILRPEQAMNFPLRSPG